jgi:paired small multidrug resistance pump
VSGNNRYWLLLALAGICEVGWVSGLKHASSAGEWALTAVGILLSFMGLIYATNKLPVGTAYAVFTGIGAAGAVLAEALFFQIPLNPSKIALVTVLIIGIAGLKMTTKAVKEES